jgi:hypothetical protein
MPIRADGTKCDSDAIRGRILNYRTAVWPFISVKIRPWEQPTSWSIAALKNLIEEAYAELLSSRRV